MLRDQLQEAYRNRFAAEAKFVWVLKFDAAKHPRDAKGRWAVTQSAAFKTWFGNSKVVDKEGKPLVVYHGTPRSGHDTFRSTKYKNVAGYFAEDPAMATIAATPILRSDPQNSSIYPVYLSLQKPVDLTELDGEQTYTIREFVASLPFKVPQQIQDDYAEGLRKRGYSTKMPVWSFLSQDTFRDLMRAHGYDGVIYNEGSLESMASIREEGEDPVRTVRSFIAFESTQVKSAIGNIGVFDPKNPSILKFDESKHPRDKSGRWTKIGERMAALKAKYPAVAENYPRDTGTEMGSIEAHTKDVGREWETQLSTEQLHGISERFGSDVQKLMQTAIPLHDIGKASAIEAGDKRRQHEYTIPIMQDVLRKEGFSEKDITLATELLNHDLIGPLFRGYEGFKSNEAAVVAKLQEKAKTVGMDVADFVTLQLAFYQADAAAYPYITQYMTREPSGKWTFSGSPKIAGVEALTRKREYVRQPAGASGSHGGEFAKTLASTLAERMGVQEASNDGKQEFGGGDNRIRAITGSQWTASTPGVAAALKGIQAGAVEVLKDYPELAKHVFVGFMDSEALGGNAATITSYETTDNAMMLFNTSKTPEAMLENAKRVETGRISPGSLMGHLATVDKSLSKEQAIEVLFRAMAIHEFGHVIDAYQGHHRVKDGVIGQRELPHTVFGRAVHEIAVDEGHGSGRIVDAEWRENWIKKNISVYAWNGGASEAWAEAFLAGRVGKLPPALHDVVTKQSTVKKSELPPDMQAWMERHPKDWIDLSIRLKREYVREPAGAPGAHGGEFAKTGTTGQAVDKAAIAHMAVRTAARTHALTGAGSRKVQVASQHFLKGEPVPESAKGLDAPIPSGVEPYHEVAAETLVNAIRNAPEHSTVLYRGLGGDYKIKSLEELKVGDTVTMGQISSFTESRQIAAYYANRQSLGGYQYELKTEGPIKSVPTDQYTELEHREHITEGKFEVVAIDEPKTGVMILVDAVPGVHRKFYVTHERSITLRQVGVF